MTGLSTALATPKISATTISVQIFDDVLAVVSSMPGTSAVAMPTAAAVISTRIRNFMPLFSHELPISCHFTARQLWPDETGRSRIRRDEHRRSEERRVGKESRAQG